MISTSPNLIQAHSARRGHDTCQQGPALARSEVCSRSSTGPAVWGARYTHRPRDRRFNGLVDNPAVRITGLPIVQPNATTPGRSAQVAAEMVVELSFLGVGKPRFPFLFRSHNLLGSGVSGKVAQLDRGRRTDGHYQCDGAYE